MTSGLSLIGAVLSVVYIALAIAVAVHANRLFQSLPIGLWGDIAVSVIAIAAFAVFLGDGWNRMLLELNDDYPRYFALAYMPFVAFVAVGFVRSLVPLIPSRLLQSAPALAMAGPESGPPVSAPPSLGASGSASGPGAPGPAPADSVGAGPKPQSKLMRRIQRGVGIAVLVLFALIYLAKFITRNDLPVCDAQTTRNTLSDIYKKINLDVKRYDQFKTNSTSDSEITCTAFVTMMDNHAAELDYLIHFDSDKNVEVKITAGRDK